MQKDIDAMKQLNEQLKKQLFDQKSDFTVIQEGYQVRGGDDDVNTRAK